MRHPVYNKRGKRILDIVFSAIGLVLFAPAMAIISILVLLDSPGAVLYRGARSGYKGRRFHQVKFRTMVADAEQLGGPKTTCNDERITRIGRVLRATKLDELPQLINVLRGEMSLVGPRPMFEEEVARYADWERRALNVRPGITDWASVRFHNEEQILGSAHDDWEGYYETQVRPEKSWLRVAYAEACSLKTDLAILFQTATVLLSTRLAWSETPDHHLIFVPWGLGVADLPEYLLAPNPIPQHALAAEARRAAPRLHVAGAAASAIEEAHLRRLLRREPVELDLEAIRPLACGETVMVTGAGGSIGSELCRQLARAAPRRIVALGHGENSIAELLGEFAQTFPSADVQPVIADVRDVERMRQVFEEHRPHSVFHAAGHKHLPLLEDSIREAVTSNVLGTRNVVSLADEYGAQHLVLISTIKAVRPTSVMGAAKRVAELVVQGVPTHDGRRFAAIRLSNVLGSRSSVLPTFLSQIAGGGPVTVTHPQMRRHFVLLRDASTLLLEAAAAARGGEVLVLDAGEPVRILDLAAALIRLHGRDTGNPIEIRFTGIRPGERLDEQILLDHERTVPTSHPRVRRALTRTVPFGASQTIERLIDAAQGGAPEHDLRMLVTRLVPDYAPALTDAAAAQGPARTSVGAA
ncbi:MAG TPA: SDR family NAD(P)-dependent oxidoreductase [Gemmatimonadales bacterium]|nr:SDR family NAD(P)-dependent oxidoreductase [Gemmatimonadales bacterium]